jgi:uncharacterized membrane protein
MKIGSLIYNFILALWVGGIFIFTFLVTPIIFRSFGRDTAGEIVGKLFPYYFPYNLILSVAALAMFLVFVGIKGNTQGKITIILLSIAVVINLFVTFKLYPDIMRVKQQIKTFETQSSESPARNQFRKLHAISAILNMLLLIDGAALVILSNISTKQEI